MKKTRRGGCEGGCYQAKSDDFTSLTEIVTDYKRSGLRRTQQELKRFRLRRGLPSIKDAIRAAALSKDEKGRPYPHQRKNWNFWPEGIGEATKALVAAANRIEACSDFDELHDWLRRCWFRLPTIFSKPSRCRVW